MIHLNFLGDMYYIQGKKCSGFLLANMGLEEIRELNVYVHGTGKNGFEAMSMLAANGIAAVGISDNNPALAGKFLGGNIISPPDKNGFIVAAIPYNYFWAFKAQMKVLGIKEWGIFISPVFNLSPHTDGQYVFDMLLRTIGEMINDTAAFGKGRFEDFIKVDPPYYYGDVERFFFSVGGSSSVMKWIDSEIPTGHRNIKLLDIGPGWGVLSHFTKNLKPLVHVEWLTLSAPHRSLEEEYTPSRRNNVPERQYLGVIEDPEFKISEQYDFIILTEVFEHFASNPINVMKRIRSMLKENGRIFFSTPNWGPLRIYNSWNEMKSFDEFADITQYSDFLFFHSYQYNKHELSEILTEAGLKILEYEVNPNNHHCLLLGKS